MAGRLWSRVQRGVDQRRFHSRARVEFEGQRFVSDLLARDPELSARGRLAPFERRVFSQNGEDGVLSEIFNRIGTINESFVEFGCGNGIENNSLYLLHRDWHGLWIDGDQDLVTSIEKSHHSFIEPGQLRVLRSLVTAENIEDIFLANEVPAEPDLISIDIDGNDYWVWQAIEAFRPRVLVVEYNAIWPPEMTWVQSYAPDRGWDGTSHHGAGLGALAKLGKKKGYRLVHCDLSGVNAFFVRDDLAAGHFAEDSSAAAHYQPARYFLSSIVARPRGLGSYEIV
ncbi:MAG: hypothetical protein GWP47_10305 [Actinobacteria bacterium]|nr:hypothetical protein [Actinomycetota bacterium]